MLEKHSPQKLDRIELRLRTAAERHGGSVLAVSRAGPDALTYTLCFSDLYAALLRADTRFAAFLPSRVAACAKGDGVLLEAISPREYCRMIHRPEIEPLAASLEDTLLAVMEDAAHTGGSVFAEHLATEDQVNMRAALPQRIDCHGTKVEELAGTGVHDAQGG
jgi:hypothetical protein